MDLACSVSLRWRDASSPFLGKPNPNIRHIFRADCSMRFLLQGLIHVLTAAATQFLTFDPEHKLRDIRWPSISIDWNDPTHYIACCPTLARLPLAESDCRQNLVARCPMNATTFVFSGKAWVC